MTNESKIESILFFKNEPVSFDELSKILKVPRESLELSISNLQKEYEGRGIVVVTDGELVSFGTHPDASAMIEQMAKDEVSRELGRAGLETLAVVLYQAPVTRREIDHIRGVNSTYTLRSLLIRGLIERVDSDESGRGYSYKPTLKLFEHLGITRKEDLPEFESAFSELRQFASTEQENDDRT